MKLGILHKAYRWLKQYKLERQRVPLDKSSCFEICLPTISMKKDYSAKGLFKFWWVSENIQYFHLGLFPYRPKPFANRKYILGDDFRFATFPLNYTFDQYFENVIKSPERALIRKAIKNGFYCKEINYGDHMDEIREINLSKEIRGGRPMSEDYVNIQDRDCIVKPYNPEVYTFGIFSQEDKLVAYYMFEQVTNFFHTVKGIGHKEYLKFGIMNYLFAYSISQLSEKNTVSHIVYGPISHYPTDGLSKFKFNVGCEEKIIIISGSSRQMKALRFFNNQYHLHGDTSQNFILDYILPSNACQ